MPKPKVQTKAINLRIELEHEQLVRDVIKRIRTGGTGFRSALRALIQDETAAEYVPANEVHARFADLERRMREDGIDGTIFVPADEIETRLSAFVPSETIDARFSALENRVSGPARSSGETYVPASEVHARFAELEERIRELEAGTS